MKIAVASDGVMVSGHFGHCEGFTMYDVDNVEVKSKVFVPNPGHKPGYLPVFLKEQGGIAWQDQLNVEKLNFFPRIPILYPWENQNVR